MLVLTRKINEVIQIGDNITVTILKVRGQIVRVGIDAPKEVRILRSELSELSTQDASSENSVQETEAATLYDITSSHRHSSSACVKSETSPLPCFAPLRGANCTTRQTGAKPTSSVRRPLGRLTRQVRHA